MHQRRRISWYYPYIAFFVSLLWFLNNITTFFDRQAKGTNNFVKATSEGSLADLYNTGPQDILCICHQDWVGIKVATYSQGCKVLEIESYTKGKDTMLLGEIINRTKVQYLIINGIPPGSLSIPREASLISPQLKISFVYHGTPAQHAGYPEEGIMLDDIMNQVIKGSVYKLGFIRRDLAHTFREMQVPNVYDIDNIVHPQILDATNSVNSNSIPKIGAFFWFSKT